MERGRLLGFWAQLAANFEHGWDGERFSDLLQKVDLDGARRTVQRSLWGVDITLRRSGTRGRGLRLASTGFVVDCASCNSNLTMNNSHRQFTVPAWPA